MSKLPLLQDLINAPQVARPASQGINMFKLDLSRPKGQTERQKFTFTKNRLEGRETVNKAKAKERKERRMSVKDAEGKPVFAPTTKERAKRVMKKVEKKLSEPEEKAEKEAIKAEKEEEKKMKAEEAKAKREEKKQKTKEMKMIYSMDKKQEDLADVEKAVEKVVKGEVPEAPKPKRKARFEKGSEEAKAWAKKMKEAREAKKASK